MPSRKPASTSPPSPVSRLEEPWLKKNQHLAAWAGTVFAVVAVLISVLLPLHLQRAEKDTKSSDEHMSALADTKLTAKIDPFEIEMRGDIKGISDQLGRLGERVAKIEGHDHIATAKLNAQASSSLTATNDSMRAMDQIRNDIGNAEKAGKGLSSAKLVNYKTQLQTTSPSGYGYWLTVAAIVNYQSRQLQASGLAPDPTKISRPCLPSGKLIVSDSSFSGCVIDLGDGTSFTNVSFKDSVIRYNGHPVHLEKLAFENCVFQLSVPTKTPPAAPRFFQALLDSPNQRKVVLN